jgi:hypothetical protein
MRLQKRMEAGWRSQGAKETTAESAYLSFASKIEAFLRRLKINWE